MHPAAATARKIRNTVMPVFFTFNTSGFNRKSPVMHLLCQHPGEMCPEVIRVHGCCLVRSPAAVSGKGEPGIFPVLFNLHCASHHLSQIRSRSQNRTDLYVIPRASLKISCKIVIRERSSAVSQVLPGGSRRRFFQHWFWDHEVVFLKPPVYQSRYRGRSIQKPFRLLQNLLQNL